MKTRDVIAFLLNLMFTGVFFAASGMSFQYYIWGKLGELQIYQMNFQGVLGFLDGYFNGNNVNYLFLNIALLMWFFIVFVTLYVIWIECRRIHAYLRIGVATWLTLVLYLAATSVIYFSFMLPYLCGMVSLSDVNEKRLVSDVAEELVKSCSYGAILFFLLHCFRYFYHLIKSRINKPQQ